MALIIEDGTQVVGANSYVTAADIETYADARGVTLTIDAEILATKAMDYIEAQSYIGTKITATQPLQWPRTGAYIDGFALADTDIPNDLKNGQMATAVAISNGNDPLSIMDGRGIIKQKVGSIEVWYDEDGSNVNYARTINNALKRILSGGNSGSMFSVTRA